MPKKIVLKRIQRMPACKVCLLARLVGSARIFLSRVFLVSLIAPAIFLFFPEVVLAQVVINKFSSNNETDWVEVYNLSESTVDLSEENYQLRDTSASGNSKDLDCLLPRSGRFSVDWGNSLNNDGDMVILLKDDEMVDCIAYGDGNGSVCEGRGQVDLGKLVSGKYGIRDPEGTGAWTETADGIKSGSIECIVVSPSPSFTPTPSFTPIPKLPTATPTSKSATPTPTPTPKTITTPTPTSKPTGPTATLFPTTGEILGEEEESSKEFYPLEESESDQEDNTSPEAKSKFLPLVFLGVGLVLLFGAGFYFWYTQIR